MDGPTAEQLRAAWQAHEEAARNARDALDRAELLLFEAYRAGWHVRDLCEATGLGYTRANERKMYRRLSRPFRSSAPST